MIYLKQALNRVKTSSPILYTIVIIHGIAALGCVLGLLIDERTLMGVNVWIKPLKFSISGAIYIFTVGLLITLYPFSERKKNWINNSVTWTLLLEIVIIGIQAARGVKSHFNTTTALDGILYGIMGLLIGINVLIMAIFLIETIRLKLKTTKPIQLAIGLSWAILLFGSWVGGQMISQLSHSIGVADGNSGLPLLNWSTLGGDLRIAHFFSLHAIQIIPLFAFVLYKKWKASVNKQRLVVFGFALTYGVWVAYTYFQAKQGIALLS